MDTIRSIFANIAVANSTADLTGLVKKTVSAFKTVNATIRQNGYKNTVPRHLLLNVGTAGKMPVMRKRLAAATSSTEVIIA
jgi:hypothetical protein